MEYVVNFNKTNQIGIDVIKMPKTIDNDLIVVLGLKLCIHV